MAGHLEETQEERFERILSEQLATREQAEALAPRKPAQETSVAKALRLTRERISAAAVERRPATPEEKRNGNITPSTTPQAANGNGQTPVQIAKRKKLGLIFKSIEDIKRLEEEEQGR